MQELSKISNGVKKLTTKKKIPALPGVYFFKDSRGKIMYIGKAANLRSRIGSYFNKSASLNADKSAMLEKAAEIDWQICDSEIEALVLEARLIKRHRPKYNVLMKDDKNYFFVGITKEEWPRVFITHQPFARAQNSLPAHHKLLTKYVGPFTDGGALKMTLKLLRKNFPYRTCKNPVSKPCFYHHLSLCPAHSSDKNAGKKYLSDLKNLIAVLKGEKKSVLVNLKKRMKNFAAREEFEKAADLRNQLLSLENIFSHRRVVLGAENFAAENKEQKTEKLEKELKQLFNANIERIECYDISNISGQNAVGSMVIFSAKNGNFKPKKGDYRKFKIKTVARIDDPAMMAEILERRLKHPEWPLPQLIILDGGKGQLSAGLKILKKLKLSIPVCALAKKEEELYLPERKNPLPLKSLSSELAFLFQRIRDEAHRFAVSYHRALRSRGLAPLKIRTKLRQTPKASYF